MYKEPNKRKGIAVLAGLAVLAVIAAAVILFTKIIISEKQFDAKTFHIRQAEQLAEDLFRIAEKQKKDLSLTIPQSEFHGIGDLQLTATVKDTQITAKAEYTGELQESMRYSAERKNTE